MKVEWWAEIRPSISAIERACELELRSSDTRTANHVHLRARFGVGEALFVTALLRLYERLVGGPEGGLESLRAPLEPRSRTDRPELPHANFTRHLVSPPGDVHEGSFVFIGGRSDRRTSRCVDH